MKMMAAGYVARGVRTYLRRSLIEDKRGLLFSLIFPNVISAFFAISFAKDLQGLPVEALGHAANMYFLVIGFTLGFLSSVINTSMGSVFQSDKVSRFLEVLLSTPISMGQYVAILALTSLAHGLVGCSLVTLVYTLSLSVAQQAVRSVLMSGWVYLLALLMTVLTSLLNVIIFVIATRVAIDPSRLSMIPSLVLFVTVTFARALGVEAIDDKYLILFSAILASAILALTATLAVLVKKLKARHILFS